MTLPPVVRVFFAIQLPSTIKEELDHLIDVLKKKFKYHPIRWTRPDNLHITLQFLAEVQSAHLAPLIEQVKAKLVGKIKPFVLTFKDLHLFPTPYRPRVIVLDLVQQEELALLSQLIGEGIKLLDYAIDTRPFRAHVTLGRIKQPQGLDLGFLSGFSVPDIEKIDLNEIVLFRSEPQPEGSQYTVLEKIAFS